MDHDRGGTGKSTTNKRTPCDGCGAAYLGNGKVCPKIGTAKCEDKITDNYVSVNCGFIASKSSMVPHQSIKRRSGRG